MRKHDKSLKKSGKRLEICRLWRQRRDFFPGKLARNHGIETIYSAQPLGGGRVLKWAPFVFIFIIFSRCHKSALLRRWLVASRQSWTLIGRESAPLRRWLVRAQYAKYVSESLLWQIDGEIRIMVLACQVGPFHLKLTQINSEMTPNRPRFRLVHRLHKSSVQQKLQDLRGADVEEMRAKVCKLARKSDMNYKFYCFTIITGISQPTQHPWSRPLYLTVSPCKRIQNPESS